MHPDDDTRPAVTGDDDRTVIIGGGQAEPTRPVSGPAEPTAPIPSPAEPTAPVGTGAAGSPPGPEPGRPSDPEPTMRLHPDQTAPMAPQDHSQSITAAAPLPKRIPAARVDEPDSPSVSQPSAPAAPISLRIGRGVVAVERSRHVRTAARRFGARTWRAVNLVLTLAIIAAAAWAGWQWWLRWHPQLRVAGATVTVVPPASVCGGEYDITGTIFSNGKAGTVTYQWVRSDGVATPRLTVDVPSGQQLTTVHLYWTFSGAGTESATATLAVTAPEPAVASAQVLYSCVS